ENREGVRELSDGLLDLLAVFADFFLCSRLDLREDRKTIASRRLRKDRAVSSLLELEVSFFRDRLCCRFRPVVFLGHFILRLSVRYFRLARRCRPRGRRVLLDGP